MHKVIDKSTAVVAAGQIPKNNDWTETGLVNVNTVVKIAAIKAKMLASIIIVQKAAIKSLIFFPQTALQKLQILQVKKHCIIRAGNTPKAGSKSF